MARGRRGNPRCMARGRRGNPRCMARCRRGNPRCIARVWPDNQRFGRATTHLVHVHTLDAEPFLAHPSVLIYSTITRRPLTANRAPDDMVMEFEVCVGWRHFSKSRRGLEPKAKGHYMMLANYPLQYTLLLHIHLHHVYHIHIYIYKCMQQKNM